MMTASELSNLISHIENTHAGSERAKREGLVRQLAAQIESGLFSNQEAEKMREAIRSIDRLREKAGDNFPISQSLPFRFAQTLVKLSAAQK